ncbi:hypothetical protein OHB01_31865 [Microbispora hainanensis]|uniref:Uncharacterized protein n=1 Tax=Microbispora hainanensis TaxID=568844 RepID=A0ABZ1SVY2_9ACTN|nr:hypothetical protein [Microbispora hainanensis]
MAGLLTVTGDGGVTGARHRRRTSHSMIGAVGEGPMLTAAGRTCAVPALDEVVFNVIPLCGSGTTCPAATVMASLTHF